MPKRGNDADSRIFCDELPTLGVSRLRAMGIIKLEDRQVIIPFGEHDRLIGVAHTKFANGGSWSYFRCPKCGGRARKLWLVADAPRCKTCCWSLGVRNRSAYAFGRGGRLAERDHRVDKLQAMLEGGRLRLKPPPPNWAIDASIDATIWNGRYGEHGSSHGSLKSRASGSRAATPTAATAPARLQAALSGGRGDPRPSIALAIQLH